MGLGIVSDEDFESEVSNSGADKHPHIPVDTIIPKSFGLVKTIERGRGQNNVNVPDSLRKILGETANINGRAEALDLASRFGISPSSVSAYTDGATSTATIADTPNKAFINERKVKVQNKARRVMLKAIDSITDERLEAANLTTVATVAKAMSGIIKDMEPEPEKVPVNGLNVNGPSIILYSPQMRGEHEYDTIVINE